MNKIVSIEKAITISKKLRREGKTVVLAGGVFDILHIAHVKFLEKAKQEGNTLFILLENDDNVRKLKGKNRPINSQKNRALVLASMGSVDYIVLLPKMKTNKQYDTIVGKIRPSIIATTAKDSNISHKNRQAKQIKGKVVCVLPRISDQSTTRLARLINQDLL